MAVPFYIILAIHLFNYRNVILVLLNFLQVLLEYVGRYSELFAATAIAMPTTLYMYQKMIGISDLAYQKYVVSIKCYKLYKFDEFIETIRGVSKSKHCINILFPRHPQNQYRQKCGQLTQYTTSNTIYHCIRGKGVISFENILLFTNSIQLEITCITQEICCTL